MIVLIYIPLYETYSFSDYLYLFSNLLCLWPLLMIYFCELQESALTCPCLVWLVMSETAYQHRLLYVVQLLHVWPFHKRLTSQHLPSTSTVVLFKVSQRFYETDRCVFNYTQPHMTAALAEILQCIAGWDCPYCLFSWLEPDHMSFDTVGYPPPTTTPRTNSKSSSSEIKRNDTRTLKREALLFCRRTSSRKWNKWKQKVAVKAWISWGVWMCYNSWGQGFPLHLQCPAPIPVQ